MTFFDLFCKQIVNEKTAACGGRRRGDCRKTRRFSAIGKEDSYERNPSGVSFVCNPPSGGIYAPGRSPPPAGGGIQTPAPRAAFASEGGGPTCPPPFAAPGRRRKPGLAAATERTHCGRQGPPWRRATGGPRPILTRAGDGPERAQGWPPPPGRPEAPKNHPAATGGRLQPARRALRPAAWRHGRREVRSRSRGHPWPGVGRRVARILNPRFPS